MAGLVSTERIGARRRTAQEPKRVLLVAEGTYPHQFGGVSTWCDLLVKSLPDVRFWVWAIAARPGMPVLFDAPANVESVVSIPLWGIRDVKEAWPREDLLGLTRSRSRVTDEVLAAEFLPAFRGFLGAVLHDDADPRLLALDIHRMHRFLVDHDLDATLGTPSVWEAFVECVQAAAGDAGGGHRPRLSDVSTAYSWIARWLFPLARPVPEVDVVHLAMAGVCCMAAAAASVEHGAGVLLTEHGVYLREQYLAAASEQRSDFLKRLGIRFARRMTELGYALAGTVAPCCDYNQRWEREMGAQEERLRTIYYGLDTSDYRVERPIADQPRTVVWVGRINPLKDVQTLLRAAAVVVAARPDARFRLFGSAPAEDAAYHQECLALHQALGLEGSVEFCGFTSRPVDAYNEGDLVVMSSVSEGLPFSILEAMLCGRPIVSTAVGGIPEQIDGVGLVVEPRDPEALGQAILAILDDAELCHRLGRSARAKAVESFGIGRFADAHRAAYDGVAGAPRARRLVSTRTDAAGPGEQAAVQRARVPRLWQLYLHGALAEGGRSAFSDLREVVRAQDPNPVDRLQVAALIEAGGVTDAVARAKYNFPDAFTLAEALFEELRRDPRRAARGLPAGGAGPPARGVTPVREVIDGLSHMDSARHPLLAFLPPAALLAFIWLVSRAGRLTVDQVLALTVGMTSGMLCTNGVAIGMGRRASRLISLGRVSAARTFLARAAAMGVGLTLLVATGVVALAPQSLIADPGSSLLFVVAASSLAVVWLVASALSLVASAGWTGVALWSGVMAGAAVYPFMPRGSHPLALASAAGYAVCLAVLLVSLERALRRRAIAEADRDRTLPSRVYLLLEATPGFLYGTCGVVMFASIHIVGWAAAAGDPTAVATLEVGLFLTLGPVILGAGHAERGVRLFWLRAAELQATTSLDGAGHFNAELLKLFRDQMRGYLRTLAVGSLVVAAAIMATVQTGVLVRTAPDVDPEVLPAIALSGLVAYAALGWGQYNAMYALSLGQWRGPLLAIALGAVVTVTATVLLADAGGSAVVAWGLAIGAALYGALALISTRKVLRQADHIYVHAL